MFRRVLGYSCTWRIAACCSWFILRDFIFGLNGEVSGVHQHWGVLSSERKPELPTRQPRVLGVGPGTLRSFLVRFWGLPGHSRVPAWLVLSQRCGSVPPGVIWFDSVRFRSVKQEVFPALTRSHVCITSPVRGAELRYVNRRWDENMWLYPDPWVLSPFLGEADRPACSFPL